MIFLTRDTGLARHWKSAFESESQQTLTAFQDYLSLPISSELVFVDAALPNLPGWGEPIWHDVFQVKKHHIVWTSSSPSDDEGIAALDAGCVGYCHAFSDKETLRNVQQVVRSGQIWVGAGLLHRLLKVANHLKKPFEPRTASWKQTLSAREVQVAELAANGASNLQIAELLHISERTVKAHLSSIFQKMNVSDRLQMTLRVHGIA